MPSSRKLNDYKVTLHTAAASLAAPSAVTDGGSIAGWHDNGAAPRHASVKIMAVGGDVSLTVAWLCAYDVIDAEWAKVAQLNGGAAITIIETLGWEETFNDVGINARLAVMGTLDANAVTVTAKPIEVL